MYADGEEETVIKRNQWHEKPNIFPNAKKGSKESLYGHAEYLEKIYGNSFSTAKKYSEEKLLAHVKNLEKMYGNPIEMRYRYIPHRLMPEGSAPFQYVSVEYYEQIIHEGEKKERLCFTIMIEVEEEIRARLERELHATNRLTNRHTDNGDKSNAAARSEPVVEDID